MWVLLTSPDPPGLECDPWRDGNCPFHDLAGTRLDDTHRSLAHEMRSPSDRGGLTRVDESLFLLPAQSLRGVWQLYRFAVRVL
jgi:hypothetical protein